MKNVLRKTEALFERFTNAALRLYGSSLAFIVALILVIIYLLGKKFYQQDFHDATRDIILCITFLSYFLIQKSINKDTTAMHIKINELVATHEKASNRVVNVEQKTEEELRELAGHYADLAEMAKDSDDIHQTRSIESVLNRQEQGGEKHKSI